LGPLAIRAFSGVAGKLTIAPRLALRDLARYQARSGAALAAVTLALGIAATVVVIASAEEAKRAREPATLSDRQARDRLGPSRDREFIPADAADRIDQLTAGARQVAARLDHATMLPLREVVEPGTPTMTIDDTQVLPPVVLAKRTGGGRGLT